ncbi:hypothetical protein TNCV_1716461 [Trichonephila clavipes]|nr:hypothetical protein TNCV_1716461 [Trichonephila clavipes]
MQNSSYCIDNENKRTKFKQYDFPTSNKNMCSDNKFHNKDQFNDANVNKSDVRIRCYNCGLFNHTSNECYHKNKGLKCFNCNQFGHKSSQCVFKKPDVKHELVNEVVSEVVNEINSSSEMRKTVKINDYDFDALIDTGSTITLIRESVHQILGRPTLNPTKINLTSFGLLTTFWIFFRCGQLIFRIADCEVEGAIASPRGIPPERAVSPTGERSSDRRNIRIRENPLGPQERQTRIGRAKKNNHRAEAKIVYVPLPLPESSLDVISLYESDYTTNQLQLFPNQNEDLGSLVYADKPQTLDHLEDNIRRVIADIRPQMLEKVIENWTSSLEYIRASRGSHMPEIIFKR